MFSNFLHHIAHSSLRHDIIPVIIKIVLHVAVLHILNAACVRRVSKGYDRV